VRIAISTLAFVLVAASAFAQSPANDYSDPKSWLCRPDREGTMDACSFDLSATIIQADGSMTREAWKADPNAPIDCFYVYPTVSTDPTPNSDMTADPAEVNVIRQQFARFASRCRPYAPLYRQVTLAGLRTLLAAAGGGSGLAQGLQYNDVRDAWKHYIDHDNKGRGFVLVAHSQGSFILDELIRREIDGKPLQSRMVSAILLGMTVFVPRGKDVGGSFQSVPLCRSATQTGCVITYGSYRSTIPPPSNARFGRVTEADMTGACTNPAAMGGGTGNLHAYLSTDGRTITGTTRPKPWVVPERPIETPWVSVPGLLSGECKTSGSTTYLEVKVNANPSDPRTDDIVGDLGGGSQVLADWGLHLVDFNIAIGNLVEIVGQQTKAWLARK